MAQSVSSCLDVPMRRLLHRINWSGQRGQSVLGRRRQAARSYRASATPVDGLGLPRRVLLLDDVQTTGATLDACTQELLGAGVEVVHAVAVVASVRGRETSGTFPWLAAQGQSSLSAPGEP
jgi:predicted amidophosphoribosyltransferase